MKKLLIIYCFFLGCGTSPTSPPETTTLPRAKTTSDKWYNGGTLHKDKIVKWKTATDNNKLATCGDFMALVDKTVPMDVLKQRAKELMICIDEATEGLDHVNDEFISTVAASCMTLMGYKL